jgi:hypothetical protein
VTDQEHAMEQDPPGRKPRRTPDDPRRAGKPSSQGLTGAQGSGGGAERGVQQPPRRRVPTDPQSSVRDNSGVAPQGDGADVSD